jgi:hypothetical protein
MSQIALVALPSRSSPTPDARLLAMASNNED